MQALYQKQATALNLDPSCSSLKEHACNKCKRVRPLEAESWDNLPSFSVVAVLSLQTCTCPGVSPGWGLFCPKRRALQQRVLSEAMVLARCVTPRSVSLRGEGAASRRRDGSLACRIPKEQARGAHCCDQESRGGTLGDRRHFACS